MFALLTPRFRAVRNRMTRLAPGDGVKTAALTLLGLGFWAFLYAVSVRVLTYFRTVEGLGDLLALRLLAMILLTFFSILLFSNVVTALSTYFLSGELEILHAAPVRTEDIFRAKFAETLLDSSWMTLIYGLPVFIAYGTVFTASAAYYVGLLLTIIPFLLIPAAIGIMVTLMLVNAFPARRARDLLVLLGLLSFVALYVLFRMLRPERLVDPESFPTLVQYLTAMRSPLSPLLPSSWAADALSSLLRGRPFESLFPLAMLWSTALAGIVIGEWLCGRIYVSGWSRSQEGRKAPLSRTRTADLFFRIVSLPFPGTMHPLVTKDLKLFFRDTSQWSQLFLLLALVVVYLYSFTLLPLERSPLPTFFLQNLISFLNLGMVGFVTTAVAVRFVFPAVSLEGEAFWIIRSSPLTIKDFLWAKFWSCLPPLLLLSGVLIVVSNLLLRVTTFMMVLSAATALLMTFGITSLGVGLGARYPRFRYQNAAQIPTGFGGIVYMLTSLLFIGAIITLEAWPVYRLFTALTLGARLTPDHWLMIIASFVLILLLMVAAFLLPLRKGIKHLEMQEF